MREPQTWADKRIEIQKSTFDNAWNHFNKIINPDNEESKEPEKCNFAAPYTINFPPSLWNQLDDELKEHERAEELELREEVASYTFNPKVDNWYNRG